MISRDELIREISLEFVHRKFSLSWLHIISKVEAYLEILLFDHQTLFLVVFALRLWLMILVVLR